MMKTWALVAAAAMGLTACQNDIDEQVEVKDSVVVTFVADAAESRTTVDTTGEKPVFAWEESNETFAVLEQTDALAEATSVEFENVDGKAKITATLDTNSGKAEYKYVAIYPESNYLYNSESIEAANLYLPAEQYMYYPNSYDPNADLMVSEVVTTSAQPTEAQMVRFTRLAAVAKMSIKELGLELGDKVEKVVFTADGKDLAGTVTTDLNNPHEFTVEEGESSVTVTTSATDVYFTLLPTTLEAGDNYTVTVFTEKYLYIKNGTIPAEKSLAFEAGKVTRLGVNMAGVAPSEKWVLVKDASTLKQGDVVAIVAKDYDKALSTKLYSNASETSTSARRDATDIAKLGEYLIADTNGNDVQKLILVTGTVEDSFCFYDEARAKFLVSNNATSRYLINQAYCDANTSFNISIDGDASATIKNTAGNYKDNMLRYYNSSKYFYSGTSANQAVCIYRLDGAVGTLPVVNANVTVPASDKYVTIAEEGATTATAISEVVFNYVGDWTISASASESWLNVAYADGALTYTAEANTGAKREAVVTITATLEGQEPLTWTFNVLQKGAPQEISIAEFMTKGQDVNVTYKLTGKITEMTSSSSGTYKITDGTNVATITYLYDDNNTKVYGSNIDLKVGDIVTVTTVVTSTTKGKGGNSSNPSIYKGHYRLEATASGAVGYEGGDATVSVVVVKGGTIAAPTTISAAAVSVDNNPVAAYNFTDNGDGTATAILSLGENTTSGARQVELSYTTSATFVGSTFVSEASVAILQEVNPALKKGWFLVTDVNDLEAGDKIIIAATGLDYAISTAVNTNNRKSQAITKNGASLKDVADNIQQYALEVDANGLYSFKGTLGTDADKYIYAASSSSNYMKVSTTLDDNGKFAIAIAADGAATVVAQGTNTRNHMQYNNKSTSKPAFYCTDGSLGDVCFYKLYE